MPLLRKAMCACRAYIPTGHAADTAVRIQQYFLLRMNGFRIVAPPAAQIAALKKDYRPHSRSVMDAEMLDIKNICLPPHVAPLIPNLPVQLPLSQRCHKITEGCESLHPNRFPPLLPSRLRP